MAGAVAKAGRRRFWIGTLLVVTSYAVYPAYAALAFLPLSKAQMAGAALAGWMTSWIVFAAGTILAGRGAIERRHAPGDPEV